MTDSLQVQGTYRNIFQLAMPIAISILIPQLNILTNTLFLGNYTPSDGLFACTRFTVCHRNSGHLLSYPHHDRIWFVFRGFNVDE
ncbi:MAG: hypothetical protein IPK62_13515 [Bacteroidetes bacterium]|nr:hypothetical protein [Bacteroidota bacterium]